MIKAVIFDFFGVLEQYQQPNRELLKYIRSHLKPNYKLGIISNTLADWVREILEPTDVELFDDIILSYQTGFSKPNPKIYELSLKNLGIKPEEAVFIDDIDRYRDAARELGMGAVLYQDFPQMKTELEELLG